MDEARAIAHENPVWPELGDIGTAACELRVSAVLEHVCEALDHAGVPAKPYEGLGVTWGHELLEAKLVLSDLDPLYERMAARRVGQPLRPRGRCAASALARLSAPSDDEARCCSPAHVGTGADRLFVRHTRRTRPAAWPRAAAGVRGGRRPRGRSR